MNAPLRVLAVTDARRGHQRQLQALTEAMARLRKIQCRFRKALAVPELLKLSVGLDRPSDQAPPQLVIGAGHKTHASVLALGRASGATTVVLMRPSLPRVLFDLCLIPDHDKVPASDRVILTAGALSPVQPLAMHQSDNSAQNRAIALIGGPIKQAAWAVDAVWQAILSWAEANNDSIDIVTSRRTPEDFIARLPAVLESRVQLPTAAQTSGWLDQALARADRIAVTADSLSMQADAVASGRPTTVIEAGISLPPRHRRALELVEQRRGQKRRNGTAADQAAVELLAWWDQRTIGT